MILAWLDGQKGERWADCQVKVFLALEEYYVTV
jgi:hypothetical protein